MFLLIISAILFQGFSLPQGGDIKQQIALQRQNLDTPLQEARLAILLYRDQEHEQAFKVFLGALERIPQSFKSHSTPEEEVLYKEALELYLERGISLAPATATAILQRYESVLQANPSYHQLRFIVAAAYANLGKFEDFFDQFYTAYMHDPDHYMAFKTKAILHIKLFERAKVGEEREAQRKLILDKLRKAQEKNPDDHTLYKAMIAFSPENERAEVISRCLNKIIGSNMILPRSEITFYVQQSIGAGQKELAERFIKKAQQWYQYSRSIEEAQKYLENK